jgi:hypothetical protein
MPKRARSSTPITSSTSSRGALARSPVDGAPSVLRPTVLGWLSIALGATAIATPSATARLIGAPLSPTTRMVLRGVGAREVGVGVGLLSGKKSSVGMTWLRVLGDAMDLSLLVGAMSSRRAKRQRLLGAVGTIAAIGLVDLAAAIMQTREERASLA